MLGYYFRETDAMTEDYKSMYSAWLQVIKDNYAKFPMFLTTVRTTTTMWMERVSDATKDLGRQYRRKVWLWMTLKRNPSVATSWRT
ncbi:MAG TPA: hypothetical protein DIS88_04020 [Prevotella sp.]|nr:hypothetical protein [Prevotella sp.]